MRLLLNSLFLLLLPVAAHAQDSGVVYAGGTVGEGVNLYAGGVTALPGAELGDGLALRGGVSGGTYEYRRDATPIDAEYYGGELALVYQTSGRWGWANFSAGGRVTETTLTPLDPDNDLTGTRYDLALQTDGTAGDRLRLRWFGSLGVFDETYIVQAALGHRISDKGETRAGVEAGVQGGPNYTLGSAGLFMETGIGDGWQGRLAAGLTDQAGRNARPYASASVSHVF